MRARALGMVGVGCLLVCLACDDEAAQSDVPVFVLPELPVFDFGNAGPVDIPGIPEGRGGGGDGNGAGLCCDSSDTCPPGLFCRERPGEIPSARCVLVPEGGCWADADCASQVGSVCEGAVFCGCDSNCALEEAAGVCSDVVPVGCCKEDVDCAGGRCLGGALGQCATVALTEGACWADSDCPKASICEGASACACGEECEQEPGACVFPKKGECTIDAHCPAGRCMAHGTCESDCDPKDPKCCNDNRCIYETSECQKQADCAQGTCTALGPCYDFCSSEDPECCLGNQCVVNLCVGDNPEGCVFSGCPQGMACRETESCVASSCSCNPGLGWECTNDCVGGQCVVTTCPGKDPSGCKDTGCPSGYFCTVVPSMCVPTACTCDEANGTWSCSADCNGGSCVKG